MKKITVAIGIPAYNEEANIGILLKSLLTQKVKNLILNKIIVASDGSNDGTVITARNLRINLLEITEGKKRLGKVTRQNQILKNTKADILVLLDADVVPINNDFLEKITKPIVEGNADLVSVPRIAKPPVTFTEKVIYTSVLLKRKLFENYLKHGQNIYTCNGAARAFSKRLYKNLRFPFTYGEDAFCYLYCKVFGYNYRFEKTTGVNYKLPDNMPDHKKQSVRFFKSQNRMQKYFSKEVVREEYRIPFYAVLKVFLQMFVERPLETTLYTIILFSMKLNSIFSGQISPLWEISRSSKENLVKN